MKLCFAALALVALAACTPQPSPQEAAVRAIYEPLVKSKGEAGTPYDGFPFTDDLKALADRAETAAGGDMPVFDFDLAGLCQDCTGFKDLAVGPPADPKTAPSVAAGHTLVEAKFKIFPDEARTVLWDMVGTTNGWRVDNILADGDFDLRNIVSDVMKEAAAINAAASAASTAEADAAVACVAYITLHLDAVAKIAKPDEATATEARRLEAASAALRAKAEAAYPGDALTQYLASSLAVFDDLTPDELKKKSTTCADRIPAQ